MWLYNFNGSWVLFLPDIKSKVYDEARDKVIIFKLSFNIFVLTSSCYVNHISIRNKYLQNVYQKMPV